MRRKSLGKCTRDQAKTILHAKEVELRTGEQILQKNVLFRPFCKVYLDWHKFEHPDSHNRIYQIVNQYLVPAFEFYSLHNLPIPEVEKYKRSRTAKPETINKELRTLQAILNKAVEWGYIPRNPIKSVKTIRNKESKPPRWYTIDELEQIYAVDPLHADIWRLMVNTGLRRAEALNLKWSDVFNNRIRVVSTSLDRTKSTKWRDLPLSPAALLALQSLQQRITHPGLYVLPRTTPRSLTRAFDKALTRSHLDGSLHCLRHTFCSHLVMNGVPLRTVQILAGHASFKTTEVYAHLSPDHLQDSVSRLNL